MESSGPNYPSIFNNFRANGEFTDLKITVEGKTFLLHRLILAAHSWHFRALLGGYLGEANSRDITLHEVQLQPFEEILNFMYTGSITINEGNFIPVLKASSFLGVEEIEKKCIDFALNNALTSSQLFDLCVTLLGTANENMLRPVINHANKNFGQISPHPMFMELPPKVFGEMMIHACEETSVDIILRAVVKWVRKDATERKQHLEELTNLLGLVNVDSPIPRVTRDEYAAGSSNDAMLGERMEITWSGESIDVMDGLRVYVETFSDDLLRIVTLNTFTFANESWKFVQNMRLSSHSLKTTLKTVSMNGNQFYMTYSDDVKPPNTFWMVDETGVRTDLQDPPLETRFFKLTNCVDSVILYDIWSDSYPFLCYDPMINQWSPVPDMPVMPKFAGTTWSNGLFYVLGGTSDDNMEQSYTACAYDRRDSKWMILPATLHDHNYGIACSYDDKVYLLGGDTGGLEVFDHVAYRWRSLDFKKTSSFVHFLAPLEGRIFSIDEKGCTGIYHVGENRWQNFIPFPETCDVPRCGPTRTKVQDAIALLS